MSIQFKRHYPLLLLFVFFTVCAIVALRNTRIIAYTARGKTTAATDAINYDNQVDLFDDTIVHQVVVLISAEDQQKMVTTYQQTGNKDYFQADIIIDGVRINKVGVRLKGNASLRSAAGGGMRGGGPGFGGGNIPLPGGIPPDEPGRAGGGQPPAGGRQPPAGGGQPPAGADRGGIASGGVATLPYLVKLDHFVRGQRYQGLAEIALRTAGAFADAALLQEPVSNYVMNSVGVPIARSVYASVQLDDGEPKLYTVAEHIDQRYIDRLFPKSAGVLYKAVQVRNDFSYLGEDPTSYANAFDQETAKNTADLAPLIAFIRFVNQASDQGFVEGLAARFDVVAFADYLAVHNLLANNDTLAGMGHNYYLYYDFGTEKFTILSWDTNEGLGKMGMGGGARLGVYWESIGSAFGRGFGGGGGAGRGAHLLMQRFLGTPEFRALYKERYRALYEQIYVHDLLTPKIEAFASLVTAYNSAHQIVDQAAFDAAVNNVRSIVTQRYEYLQSTELLRR